MYIYIYKHWLIQIRRNEDKFFVLQLSCTKQGDIVDFFNLLYMILYPQIGLDHDDAETPAIYNTAELNRASFKDKAGRWARATFKIVLSYHGNSFDGWQKQPGLNTVQG